MIGPLWGSGVPERVAAVPGVDATIVGDLGAVAGALARVPILVTFRWDDSWLSPDLRWVQSVSSGIDQFPIEALRANGTVLTSGRGLQHVPVAEHAMGLLLAMTRGIALAAVRQPRHEWRWSRVDEIEGKTMGILGLGTIGEAIAVRAAAFGMTVIGTKRSPEAYRGVASDVLPPGSTLEVFRRSDVVVIALPGSPDTERLVGRSEIEALAGGWLVNVGRGGVVDQDALVAAMREGTLAGAALDVFPEEPLPEDSALWDLPGVLISPHQAGASPGFGDALAGLVARNLDAYHGQAAWVNRVV